VTTVGKRSPTSRAKLGPDRTANLLAGSITKTSFKIPEIVRRVLFSIPLEAETTTASSFINSTIFFAVSLTTWEGVAISRNFFPETTLSISLNGEIFSDSFISGKKVLFSIFSDIWRRTSSSKTHRSTGKPFKARRFARAVPQLPAPMTPIFIFFVFINVPGHFS